jgi:hypothetical protein
LHARKDDLGAEQQIRETPPVAAKEEQQVQERAAH